MYDLHMHLWITHHAFFSNLFTASLKLRLDQADDLPVRPSSDSVTGPSTFVKEMKETSMETNAGGLSDILR